MIRIKNEESFLFVKEKPESYSIWIGPIPTETEIKEKYGFDNCNYFKEEKEIFEKFSPKFDDVCTIYVLNGVNTDSRKRKICQFDFKDLPKEKFVVDQSDKLFNEITEARVTKSEEELNVYRYTCEIASKAQIKMMQSCKVGMREYQLEAIFQYFCLNEGGCRLRSFKPICSSSPNSSILHYIDNSNVLKDGSLVLCDMGCSYNGFCSDITRTFPVNGKFSKRQKKIYNLVLDAQTQVIKRMKPGVSWIEMHNLACRIIITGLKEIGILKGEIEEMEKLSIPYYFMPHGLGHFMGLIVHDVGGYKKGVDRSTKLSESRLRTVRVLQEGMVITVEPGCYFNKILLKKALKDEKLKGFFNVEILESYFDFGGIRIEDDVVVTTAGVEVLTKLAPKTCEEIEKIMK